MIRHQRLFAATDSHSAIDRSRPTAVEVSVDELFKRPAPSLDAFLRFVGSYPDPDHDSDDIRRRASLHDLDRDIAYQTVYGSEVLYPVPECLRSEAADWFGVTPPDGSSLFVKAVSDRGVIRFRISWIDLRHLQGSPLA